MYTYRIARTISAGRTSRRRRASHRDCLDGWTIIDVRRYRILPVIRFRFRTRVWQASRVPNGLNAKSRIPFPIEGPEKTIAKSDGPLSFSRVLRMVSYGRVYYPNAGYVE